MKITHLTSVHPRYDTRIFFKICVSLAKNKSYKINLLVADGKGDEFVSNVNILDIGKSKGRLQRILNTTKKIYKESIKLDSDIYHFHDPELIPVGLKLKKIGKKVIFDIHENIALQILDKDYIPSFLRKTTSAIYRYFEKKYLKKFDALILAEDSYKDYYNNLNKNIEVILNMPDLSFLKNYKINMNDKSEIFYIGGISNNRGFDVTIKALNILKNKFPNIFMHYIGPFSQSLLDSVDMKDLDGKIKFYGRMSLLEGLNYSKNSKVGLSILKPIGNYTKSYSTKVFEYMALGLPVVTSNFKLYKDVIEKYNCGICINPLDEKEIATAIEYILKNPEKAKEMGTNGKKIVFQKYNWEVEEKKLYKVYKEL